MFFEKTFLVPSLYPTASSVKGNVFRLNLLENSPVLTASQRSTGVNIQIANGEFFSSITDCHPGVNGLKKPNQVLPSPLSCSWCSIRHVLCRRKKFPICQNWAILTSTHYNLEMCQKVKKLWAKCVLLWFIRGKYLCKVTDKLAFSGRTSGGTEGFFVLFFCCCHSWLNKQRKHTH